MKKYITQQNVIGKLRYYCYFTKLLIDSVVKFIFLQVCWYTNLSIILRMCTTVLCAEELGLIVPPWTAA